MAVHKIRGRQLPGHTAAPTIPVVCGGRSNGARRYSIFASTVVVILMATMACGVESQVPVEVSSEEFFAARVNGAADLRDFVTYEDDWEPLKLKMGQPLVESCDTTPVEVDCTLSWDGVSALIVDYPDKLNLLYLDLTGPGAFLDYGGATIRVGDPIEQLQKIFPAAYEQRGHDCASEVESGHECSHAAIVTAPDDLNSMSFTYDPHSGLIETIRYRRNIV